VIYATLDPRRDVADRILTSIAMAGAGEVRAARVSEARLSGVSETGRSDARPGSPEYRQWRPLFFRDVVAFHPHSRNWHSPALTRGAVHKPEIEAHKGGCVRRHAYIVFFRVTRVTVLGNENSSFFKSNHLLSSETLYDFAGKESSRIAEVKFGRAKAI